MPNWDDTLTLRQAGAVPGFHGHNTPMEDWNEDGTETVLDEFAPPDSDEVVVNSVAVPAAVAQVAVPAAVAQADNDATALALGQSQPATSSKSSSSRSKSSSSKRR